MAQLCTAIDKMNAVFFNPFFNVANANLLIGGDVTLFGLPQWILMVNIRKSTKVRQKRRLCWTDFSIEILILNRFSPVLPFFLKAVSSTGWYNSNLFFWVIKSVGQRQPSNIRNSPPTPTFKKICYFVLFIRHILILIAIIMSLFSKDTRNKR